MPPMAYRPPQRAIRATLLTFSRWIRGTFHLPRLHAFEDHLAKRRQFLTLTDVALGGGPPVPFLALRTSAAHVIVPDVRVDELYLAPRANAVPREVTCLLERVVIRGRLELLPGVRTSDFLVHQDGYLALHDARITPPLPDRVEPLPVVFVDARAVVAIAELDGEPGERAEPEARPLATPAPVA